MRYNRRGSFLPTLAKVLDDAFQANYVQAGKSLATTGTTPLVNVKNTENDYVIELAAPGMSKEDFNVELNNNVLTISSKQEQEIEEKDENNNYSRKEFSYTSFKRSFNLDEKLVNEDEISATYKDGVLSVTLPKKEEAKEKPAKTIEISE